MQKLKSSDVTRLTSYKLFKYKIYIDCLYSMNALASVLEDPQGGKSLALSFR
jgi:hypothetical protein